MLLVLAAGLGYYIWIQLTGLAIPCIFRSVTGWLCPGCGITTLILHLVKLDIQGAWMANPFLFATGPLLIVEGLYVWHHARTGRQLAAWNQKLLIGYAAALLVFGVLRNL